MTTPLGQTLKLVVPSTEYAFRNFYVPMLTAMFCFVMFTPGVLMYWQGNSVSWNSSDSVKDKVPFHCILFALAYTAIALLFAIGLRTWPGSQQVTSKFEPVKT